MRARWREVIRISLRRTSQIGQQVRARMIDEHEILIARECDRPSADLTRQRLTVLSLSLQSLESTRRMLQLVEEVRKHIVNHRRFSILGGGRGHDSRCSGI